MPEAVSGPDIAQVGAWHVLAVESWSIQTREGSGQLLSVHVLNR